MPADLSAIFAKPPVPVKSTQPAGNRSLRINQARKVRYLFRLGEMFSAGVPLYEAVGLIAEHADEDKEFFLDMQRQLRNGQPLSRIFSLYPSVFPRWEKALVAAGEMSGGLPQMITQLAQMQSRSLQWRSQTIASLIYPSLILVVAVIAVLVMIMWVIPQMAFLFNDRADLPWLTRVFLNISSWMGRTKGILLSAAAGSIFAVGAAWKKGLLQQFFQTIYQRLPFVSRWLALTDAYRLSLVMGMLLREGVPMDVALDAVKDIPYSRKNQEKWRRVSQDVMKGSALGVSLRKHQFLDEWMIASIRCAARAGRIHQGFFSVSSSCERQLKQKMQVLISVIEPALIILIGGLVALILGAVFLPVVNMNTNVF